MREQVGATGDWVYSRFTARAFYNRFQFLCGLRFVILPATATVSGAKSILQTTLWRVMTTIMTLELPYLLVRVETREPILHQPTLMQDPTPRRRSSTMAHALRACAVKPSGAIQLDIPPYL